jgi:DnaJ_bact: chaperone protein DnaJ
MPAATRPSLRRSARPTRRFRTRRSAKSTTRCSCLAACRARAARMAAATVPVRAPAAGATSSTASLAATAPGAAIGARVSPGLRALPVRVRVAAALARAAICRWPSMWRPRTRFAAWRTRSPTAFPRQASNRPLRSRCPRVRSTAANCATSVAASMALPAASAATWSWPRTWRSTRCLSVKVPTWPWRYRSRSMRRRSAARWTCRRPAVRRFVWRCPRVPRRARSSALRRWARPTLSTVAAPVRCSSRSRCRFPRTCLMTSAMPWPSCARPTRATIARRSIVTRRRT